MHYSGLFAIRYSGLLPFPYSRLFVYQIPESASLQPVCPGFDSQTRRHNWTEFQLLVLALPCPERFLSGYSGFTLSSKTNISKFQFDLDYCQALNHEPLARMIAQAPSVFDIKFTFTFYIYLFARKREGNLYSKKSFIAREHREA